MIYKNVRKIIEGIGTGKDFLKRTLVIQEINGNNWHMGPHKNKQNMHSKGSSSLSANIYGLQNGRGYCYTLSRILIARIQKKTPK